jgi:hypothetical protein
VAVAVAVTAAVALAEAVAVGGTAVRVAEPVARAVAVAVTAAVAPGVAPVADAVGVALPLPPLPPGGAGFGADGPLTLPVGRTIGATVVGVAGILPASVVVPLSLQRARKITVNARSTREMSVPLVRNSASRRKFL